MTSCVVLFSGGIDSTTALYWCLRRYATVFPLSIDYGQRHRIEISLATQLLQKLDLSPTILEVDLTGVGGSVLTDSSLPLPEKKKFTSSEPGPPPTYVPFRNGIFLSLAAAWAEARGVPDIVCGFHVFDSPDYPDTRKEFVAAMEKAINLGTKAAFGGPRTRVLAPFVAMSKSEIIREGLDMGADYAYSISCYAGQERPCDRCSACRLRKAAWKKVGAEDPLVMRLREERMQ